MPEWKTFRTAGDADPFEKLQKWTTWLFALNPILASLALGTGQLVFDPKGLAAILPALSILLFGISLAFAGWSYSIAVAEAQPSTVGARFDDEAITTITAAYGRKREALRRAGGSLAAALVLACLTPLAAELCSPGRGVCFRSPRVVVSYELTDTVLVTHDTIFTKAQILHGQASGREFPSDRNLTLALKDREGLRTYALRRSGPDSTGAVRLGVQAVFTQREEVSLEADWCPQTPGAGKCSETILLTAFDHGH